MLQISSRTEHTNPWFTVEHREYETERGARHPYFVVCRSDSVMVVPRQGEHYVLVELTRPVLGGLRSLEFPCGGTADGETPEEAARREAREEAGLELTGVRHLGTFAESNGFATSSCHVFVADVAGTVAADRDVFEADLAVHRYTWAQLGQLVAAGGIGDSSTLAALALMGASGDGG
ncbi:NUDIX domain-containing protein [Streptomyces sp. ID05-26A]|nr:NUDIX domain-containing protein [Streptomyces sp. ID05-26A]